MAFKQINNKNQDQQLIQGNVQAALSDIQQGPFFNGNKLGSVSLTSGQDNQISHKLGHTPSVWFLVDQNTNTTVWRTTWNSQFLTLRCGTSCVVSLWVS